MAHSFFPDLGGSSPERVWRAASPGPGAPSVPRVVWLATLLITVVSGVLASVFAGLWWRGEMEAESVRTALDRVSTETIRLTGEQSRQRRVFAGSKIENLSRMTVLNEETKRLRQALAASQAETAATEQERQLLGTELQHQHATGRQQASYLQQERSRAAVLEQNLSLTQNDLNQRAAVHDQHLDSLQTHLVALRDTVTVREIEVRNITSAATEEIDRTRTAAQEVAHEAEWLAAQLRSVTCERDRLHQEVIRLEQSLQSERAANHSLAHRIQQLECRIRELEARPLPSPGAGSGTMPVPGHVHSVPHRRPAT